MLFVTFVCFCLSSLNVRTVLGLPGRTNHGLLPEKGQHLLQDIVTWDANSLIINGERLMIYSGEFHPFRLPVPSLWLDIFQKIKALGFNTVSFYVDWALLEGKQGDFSAEGVFGFEPFFDAAKEAGIYLLARPGPYINAESSGGGFPGWIQRTRGNIRTSAPDFVAAVEGYISKIGPIMAKAQITNGGPIILLQPENEYSHPEDGHVLDKQYMQDVEDAYRKTGIVVPFINNDGLDYGYFAPGTGLGEVDIYGHDSYPLGFDCSHPYNWTGSYFPTDFQVTQYNESPSTPYAIVEFQGGSFDPWGGPGYDSCAILLNNEFERVYYKNDYSFGVKIFNLYMGYGGTNWGNLGFPVGYTSYDYGSMIKEDRTVWREKYSEVKLQANFFRVSPAYLVAYPHNATNHSEYANTNDINVTPLTTDLTSFYVVRHTNWTSMASTDYTLRVPTSAGTLTLPQLGGSLTLNGRDAKVHLIDYPVGSFKLLYSTAEIFTWTKYGSKTTLLLYGGIGETHEIALKTKSQLEVIEGHIGKSKQASDRYTFQWEVSTDRTIVQVESLTIYLLDRNSAYNYWVLDLPAKGDSRYSTSEPVVVKGGYLLRTAELDGNDLHLSGDINSTTSFEVISAPKRIENVMFNGKRISQVHEDRNTGIVSGVVKFEAPKPVIPSLSAVHWRAVDSLPEIYPSYDDSKWTKANHTYTNNTETRNLTTPTSLYSSDYGYNGGSLIYRGHFTAHGNESQFSIQTQGGDGYGTSIWLGDSFLDSWVGAGDESQYTQNLTLSSLSHGKEYVITVLIDHMGNEESGPIYSNTMKNPRGILDYTPAGHPASDVSWKLTGNLGGEDYKDRTCGPLNEGAMFAERQGWHQPKPPTSRFSNGSPLTGLSKAGVSFYFASFDLDMPDGYDIPLSFVFANSSATRYRSQLYVNGYQFGKYINHIGPQTAFPVPEGILNYHGTNYIAVSLWAMDPTGAKIEGLSLEPTALIQSGYGRVELSPMPAWTPRPDAY